METSATHHALAGEAISIGQIAAAKISSQLAGLSEQDVARITSLLAGMGLPTQIRLNARQGARLLKAMQLDKKVSGGEIHFVLAQKIGTALTGQKVPPKLIESALS